MKLTDYINNVVLPFCVSVDGNNPVKTSDFQSALSSFIDISYGDFALRRKVATDGDGNELSYAEVKTIINRICENVYTTNKYKYDTLYRTTVQVYDPIENYNMEEEGKDSSTDTLSGSHTIGQQANSKSGTNTIGSQTDSGSFSTTYGAQSNSDNATDSKKVSPFNTNSYTNAEEVVHTGGETLGSHTDNGTTGNTFGQRQDTSSESETLGSHTDTDSETKTSSSEHDFSRHGNIGVTTTQQMLEQERNVALFNLYSVVANDILKKIAIVVY